jgi:hypothetical protein
VTAATEQAPDEQHRLDTEILLKRIRSYGSKLPDDCKFDRSEANARSQPDAGPDDEVNSPPKPFS